MDYWYTPNRVRRRNRDFLLHSWLYQRGRCLLNLRCLLHILLYQLDQTYSLLSSHATNCHRRCQELWTRFHGLFHWRMCSHGLWVSLDSILAKIPLLTKIRAWYAITIVGVYAKYSPGSAACDVGGGTCSQAKLVGLLVFITFAAYWITEVIKNVIHVTISGVYGSWYFCAQKPGGFPKGATGGAFKRAMTYSFGSISLGSLLVAIIQFLRYVHVSWCRYLLCTLKFEIKMHSSFQRRSS